MRPLPDMAHRAAPLRLVGAALVAALCRHLLLPHVLEHRRNAPRLHTALPCRGWPGLLCCLHEPQLRGLAERLQDALRRAHRDGVQRHTLRAAPPLQRILRLPVGRTDYWRWLFYTSPLFYTFTSTLRINLEGAYTASCIGPAYATLEAVALCEADSSGDIFLERLGYQHVPIARNLLILLAMWAALSALTLRLLLLDARISSAHGWSCRRAFSSIISSIATRVRHLVRGERAERGEESTYASTQEGADASASVSAMTSRVGTMDRIPHCQGVSQLTWAMQEALDAPATLARDLSPLTEEMEGVLRVAMEAMGGTAHIFEFGSPDAGETTPRAARRSN